MWYSPRVLFVDDKHGFIYHFSHHSMGSYELPTSDVPVLCQAGDAEQISTLGPAAGQRLTPGQDGVQIELVTGLQLLV